MKTPELIAATLLEKRVLLTAYIANLTRDFHLAEDLFQEVCVKAVARAAEFESAQHVISWAFVTGRNRAIDAMRKRGAGQVELTEGLLETLAAEWPDKLQVDPEQDALALCLEQVTPNNRELLRLRYFERRPCAEVAGIMGRKLETVYQALTRIHHVLANCIQNRLNPKTP
jgi:RNA polymerase sigma-70 factor (ECF subfamily)